MVITADALGQPPIVTMSEGKTYSFGKGKEKKTLLTIDFEDTAMPGTVRIARCNMEQLAALGNACFDAVKALEKRQVP